MSSQANTQTLEDLRRYGHHRYPTAREFCRVFLRLVDSEQSDKHRKRVKPVRFYGVPLLSIPFARTFRLVALRDLESFVIQNHAALGSLQTVHRTTAYLYQVRQLQV